MILVVGLVLCGTGAGLFVERLTSLETIDPEQDLTMTKQVYKYTDFEIGDELNVYPANYVYEVDDSVEGIEIVVSYPDVIWIHEAVYETFGMVHYELHSSEEDYRIMKLIKEDLSKDTIRAEYNFYDKASYTIRCNQEFYNYFNDVETEELTETN